MSVDTSAFREEVYSVVAVIPRGKVMTYGQIAWLVGWPQHSRLVGRMLREVPTELSLPCHRVVNAQGRMAPHWAELRLMLESEGVVFRKNGCVDLRICRWDGMSER